MHSLRGASKVAKQNLKCWSCFECWFRPASDLEDLGIGLRLFVAWQLIIAQKRRIFSG